MALESEQAKFFEMESLGQAFMDYRNESEARMEQLMAEIDILEGALKQQKELFAGQFQQKDEIFNIQISKLKEIYNSHIEEFVDKLELIEKQKE